MKRIIAGYSKPKVVGTTLGPFVALGLLWLLLSPYSLAYIFSWENWNRPSAFSPPAPIAILFVGLYVGICLYQLVTIVFLGKSFVWTDGENLMVGYRNMGPLDRLRPQESQVTAGPWFDRVRLVRSGGPPILLNTGMARDDGAQLLRAIADIVPPSD